MQRKYPFTSVLGWSVSRYEKFTACKRQYWYDYYARKWDRDVPHARLDALRSLTSTPLEIGNLVHDAIATQLHRMKNQAPLKDPSEVVKYAGYLVDRSLQQKTFLEVYYGIRKEIDENDLKERVGTCLKSFFESPWYEWLRDDAAHRRSEWVIEPNDFGEMRIDGLKAYCKVDFLIPGPAGDLFVLDWKTGRMDAEKHRRQMTGYVAYAQDIFGVTAELVKPVVIYLGAGYEEMESRFGQGEIDEFAQVVRAQTQEMYAYCEDAQENIPKEKQVFEPNLRRMCAYCNYQELCAPDGAAGSR